MFPERFIERIKLQPYFDAGNLLKALEAPSPVSIRINPGKINLVPAHAERVKWCKNGYYLDFRPLFTLDPFFHGGAYYPQEASGMFLEEIFNQLDIPALQPKILDLCGAPGGKSTHISSLIGSRGTLVSNEVIRSRALILKENLTRWGSFNTIITQNDPSDFSRLKGFFDVILIDAPCSGEGMFRDQVARNEWSELNAAYCSQRQKRILSDIWPSLGKDGFLIYSTCTFNPAENEHNVKWLTEKLNAESIRLKITDFPGINEIEYKGIMGYGFYPGEIMGEGLFFSVLRKNERTDNFRAKFSGRQDIKPGTRVVEKASLWTEFKSEDLMLFGDSLAAISDKNVYLHLLAQKLKIIKAGTDIFTLKNKTYVPSHELALSLMLKKNAFPSVELDFQQALQYLKRSVLKFENMPEGWFLVNYKGIELGFVNNIGKRTNNYYPVGWRIRMDIPAAGSHQKIKWEN
jgi:16S rRNA C967 or C1407 C5-methylase (RsmB/RsmF family)/NOL1/NOP2/fmu family ribosome biogenesis protein